MKATITVGHEMKELIDRTGKTLDMNEEQLRAEANRLSEYFGGRVDKAFRFGLWVGGGIMLAIVTIMSKC